MFAPNADSAAGHPLFFAKNADDATRSQLLEANVAQW
jgi:hypothetical protein